MEMPKYIPKSASVHEWSKWIIKLWLWIIVFCSFSIITKNTIRFLNFLEFIGIAAFIGVMLFGHTSVGLFDFVGSGASIDA
jgi:hypothetical protein